MVLSSIKKTVTILFLIVISAFLCTSCSKSKTDTETAKLEALKAQTSWYILNENGGKAFLKDDNKDVMAIKELIVAHSKAVDTRSWKNDSFDQEMSFYTNELSERLQKYPASIKKIYSENELELKHLDIWWYEISFKESMDICKVKMASQIQLISGKESYLTEQKLKSGLSYLQYREFDLTKSNNEWKINDLKKGALIENKNLLDKDLKQ